MKTIRIWKSLILVPLFAFITQQALPQDQIGKWKRFETSITNPTYEGNPFDVEFKGIFQSPSGRVLKQWGFYAGDHVWKVYFMPDETGTWTYRTQSADDDLNGKKGSFICISSDLPGLLTNDGAHWILKERGGTFPVIWNPPVSNGNHWGFRGYEFSNPMVQEALTFASNTVGARVLGFYALLDVPTGWSKNWPQSAVPYVIGKEGVQFYTPFWDQLNAKMDAARDMGMGHYIMFYSDDELTPDRFGLTPKSKKEIHFFRYVLARLACYPIVLWDSGIDISEYRSNEWIDWFVQWIHENDPWQHPVGSRTGGGSGGKIPESATYFSTGGAFLPSRDELIDGYWKTATQRQIPIAHTDHWRPFISRGKWNHDKIRVAHWRCALSGGQALFPDYNQGPVRWKEVIEPGGPWIGFASKFFNEMLHSDIRDLIPNDKILSSNDLAIAAANLGKEYVIYLEEGGSVQVALPKDRDSLKARWYNPRTGSYDDTEVKIGQSKATTFTSPTQGKNTDWVLHIVSDSNVR